MVRTPTSTASCRITAPAVRRRTLAQAWAALTLVGGLAGCALAPPAGELFGHRSAAVTLTAHDWPARIESVLPTDVLLLGETHDAPDHQRLQRETVRWLAERGLLAGVVMEMVERGHSTAGLPRDAAEPPVQEALQWNTRAWPWQAYGPVVMAAVAAGVPVSGGNLPRSRMRAAMADTRWDQHLPAPALERQRAAVREGHCGLLPEERIAPMVRIQIARDAEMAEAAREALRPGQTVLLIAGHGHVLRDRAIPTHWTDNFTSKVALAHAGQALEAIDLEADVVIQTPPLPARDHCAELRAQWKLPAHPTPAASGALSVSP